MSVRSLVWVPPSLCGCELRMTANFLSEPFQGKVYQHPVPFSIQKGSLKIVAVCSQHYSLKRAMPDTRDLFDYERSGGEEFYSFMNRRYGFDDAPLLKQSRGYLRYPIAEPTEAECLYTGLYWQRGQRHSLFCGCVGHRHGDISVEHDMAKGVWRYVRHPIDDDENGTRAVYYRKCRLHRGDTLDLKRAKLDTSLFMTSRPDRYKELEEEQREIKRIILAGVRSDENGWYTAVTTATADSYMGSLSPGNALFCCDPMEVLPDVKLRGVFSRYQDELEALQGKL